MTAILLLAGLVAAALTWRTTLDYQRVDGDPYPHQVTERFYLLGRKVGERLAVSAEGIKWYSFPSLRWTMRGDVYRDEMRRHLYVDGRAEW